MTANRLAERPVGARRIDDLADLITPMAIRVAASLRLADFVHDGVTSVDALAERVAVDPAWLDALVGHLVQVDVFTQDAVTGLRLTRLGKQLRVAQRYLDMEDSVGRSELSLVRLLDAVRSGQAAYPLHFGRSFWDDLMVRPAMKATFDAMTDRHLDYEFEPLLAAYDFGAAGHVVDLGAGNGELVVRLMRRFPDLRGSIVDLPGNTEVPRRSLDAAGLTARGDVIGADFFQPMTHLPRGTFVLANVLHDWNDTDTGAILTRCREALHPDGHLLIIDSFSTETTVDTQMDLRMLALFGGRQRTVGQLGRIAEGAGLVITRAQILRRKWLLELRPAPRQAVPGAPGSTVKGGDLA